MALAVHAGRDFFAEQWHMRRLEGPGRGYALEALARIGSARSIPYLLDSMNDAGPGFSVSVKDGRMEYDLPAPFHVIYRIGTRNEVSTRRALEEAESMTEPVKRVLQIVDYAWKDGSAVVVPPRSWE